MFSAILLGIIALFLWRGEIFKKMEICANYSPEVRYSLMEDCCCKMEGAFMDTIIGWKYSRPEFVYTKCLCFEPETFGR
jgi:hypothetical protein